MNSAKPIEESFPAVLRIDLFCSNMSFLYYLNIYYAMSSGCIEFYVDIRHLKESSPRAAVKRRAEEVCFSIPYYYLDPGAPAPVQRARWTARRRHARSRARATGLRSPARDRPSRWRSLHRPHLQAQARPGDQEIPESRQARRRRFARAVSRARELLNRLRPIGRDRFNSSGACSCNALRFSALASWEAAWPPIGWPRVLRSPSGTARAAKAEPLAGKGAKVAATPREAATGADFIFAMVADDDASRSVWLGADGALAGAKSGAIGVESSTLTPDWIRELGRHARGQGCRLPRCAGRRQPCGGGGRRTEVLCRGRPPNLRGGAPCACGGGQQDGSARASRRGRDLEAHQQPARRRSDRRARRGARGRQKGRLQDEQISELILGGARRARSSSSSCRACWRRISSRRISRSISC